MIYSETIETVYSNVETIGILSEEETDFRFLDEFLRLTEDNAPRETQNDEPRILE